jgi:5-methylcytosine-specific restriction endonuclease McrA
MPEFLSVHDLRQRKRQILAVATHCALCREPLQFDAPPRSPMSPSVDHKVARELGGDDSWQNLQPAHFGCNGRKGYRPVAVLKTCRAW